MAEMNKTLLDIQKYLIKGLNGVLLGCVSGAQVDSLSSGLRKTLYQIRGQGKQESGLVPFLVEFFRKQLRLL